MAITRTRDCCVWFKRTLRRQIRANQSIFAICLVLVSLMALLLFVRISRRISDSYMDNYSKSIEFQWDFEAEKGNTNDLDKKLGEIREFHDAPIRNFKFYALHKTGSTITRHELERFCADEKLKCLGYASCHLHPIEVIRCFRNNTKANELTIDYGTFTLDRLNAGCCPLMQDVQMFHGLIDHFSLRGEANRRFLDNSFHKNAFQFTIVREPSEQFISYHKMLYRVRYQFAKVPSLRDTIGLCYNHTRHRGQPLTDSELQICQLLTNSQSKELGWTGQKDDGSLNDVIKFLTRLDFVGHSAHLCQSWQLLRERLRWPRHYFPPKLMPEHSRDDIRKLGTTYQAMLSYIQFADYVLHSKAVAIFESYLREQLTTMKPGATDE